MTDEMNMNEKAIEELVVIPKMAHRVGSIGYVEKLVLAELILISQPKLIVETGVFHGDTTKFMAQMVVENRLEPCRIVGFDFVKVLEEVEHAGTLSEYPFVELIGGSLPSTLKEFLDKSPPIDFAIVDASHQHDAVKAELKVLMPAMARNSYVFCHDYRPDDPEFKGTCKAVDWAVKKFGLKMIPLIPSELRGQEIIWGAAVLMKS